MDKQNEIDGLKAELADARSRLATLEADRLAWGRRFEELLESSDRNYREIFEAVMTAICVHELPSGRIVDANQAMLDMFGCSREQVLEPDFWDRATLGPPYDAAAALAVLRTAAAEGCRTVQWPVRRANGEPFWIEVTLKRAMIGGTPCIVSLSTDVTDRRRAEQELAESRRKLSGAMSIAKLGYWEYDAARDEFTFDDHFYAIFRTTAEKVGGYTMSPARYAELFMHPDDAASLAAEIRASVESDDPNFSRYIEHRMLYADGEVGYLGVRYFVVKDEHGRTVGTYGANQDITDRKRAEETLRASEQNYREIFNASVNPIGLVDGETGRFVDVNQAMLDMHGLSHEDALRMTIADISVDQSPEARRQAFGLLRRAIEDGPQRFEWHCRRANGSPLWMDLTAQRAMIGGRPHVLAVASDVTERNEARQRLLQERQTLRQLLQSQERERRLIAYEIHDGLAQQLAAAAMYCSVFDQLRETSPEDAVKSHEAGAVMLQKALAETRRLIRGLRPAVLDESGLVAAVKSLIEEIESREGIEVEFGADVQFVRLDPVWENSLFRIVQESLTNAARYSGTSKIRVQLAQAADRLMLEIQDWGHGFDPAAVPEDRFGLMGIRERAALLGGRATIRSAPGEGALIHVELPVEEASGSQSPPPS